MEGFDFVILFGCSEGTVIVSGGKSSTKLSGKSPVFPFSSPCIQPKKRRKSLKFRLLPIEVWYFCKFYHAIKTVNFNGKNGSKSLDLTTMFPGTKRGVNHQPL